MRPLADLGHSAYDTLEFIKEHYPEMVQMYETIMAHLKVPASSSSSGGSDTHVPYTITDVFDTIIIDPDLIHNTLGYTDEEIPIMCKRAGLKYLGLYEIEARTFTHVNGHYEEVDDGNGGTNTVYVYEDAVYPARQVPWFAVIKGEEIDYRNGGMSFFVNITSIPVNHKRAQVRFTAHHSNCADYNFSNLYSNFRKGILWNCAYAHQYVDGYTRYYTTWSEEEHRNVTIYEGSTYGEIGVYDCVEAILDQQVTTSVTTLIDVNDEIDLPEVL